jgi:hypothetical protein
MVGKTGFEPATPWSQTKCSTKLSYFPQIMARPEEVESTTFWSVVRRSIQLSYGRKLSKSTFILYQTKFDMSTSFFGAAERTWTSTGLPPLGPQPSASAIPPRPHTFQRHLLSYQFINSISRVNIWLVRVKGVEPPRLAAPDPKSGASANSATPANIKYYFLMKITWLFFFKKQLGEPWRIRTFDPLIKSQMLYQLS